jgi:hypothetical protein
LPASGWAAPPAALEVQVHEAPATAERLLLAGSTVERRVAMLGAGLAGKHHELLGADTLGVDVDDDLQPRLLELREAEVGHFDAFALHISAKPCAGTPAPHPGFQLISPARPSESTDLAREPE